MKFVFTTALLFCILNTTIAQRLQSVELFTVEKKAKEKYGSFDIKEKIINHYIAQTIDTGGNIALGKNEAVDFILLNDENSTYLNYRIFTKDPKINRIRVVFLVDTLERFYGAGVQPSHFILNGHRFPVITMENGIGRGDQPISKFSKVLDVNGETTHSYYPLPHVISSANYSLSLAGASIHHLSYFDFSQKGKIIIDIESSFFSCQITRSRNFSDLYRQSYFLPTSSKNQYPEWSYGTILGIQGGREKVEYIVDSCLKIGNPIKAIWIQDWCGRRKTRLGSQLKWEWKPDTTLYPDFKNWVAYMNQKGVKVLGYVNPFLATNTSMFKEAEKNGFLIKNKNDKVHILPTGGFEAALVNLIDKNAKEWLTQIIEKNMIENGLSGWMADFGEWCPLFMTDSIQNTFFSPHLSWSEEFKINYAARNKYVANWAEVNNNAIQKYPDNNLLFFMRAGATLSNQQCPMYWMGDQMVGWGEHDGLKSTVTAMNSAAMSGIHYIHSDIGGYTSVNNIFIKQLRDEELLARWAEINVFQPFFRTHEGLLPKENHQVYTNQSSMEHFARMGRFHYALKDYRKQYESRNNPFPMARPLVLDYPNDPNCYDLKYQFMYGTELMVAPVLDSGVDSLEVYVPKGEWTHLYSSKSITGGKKIKVYTPIGQPAIFVKTNSSWRPYFEWLIKEFL